MIRVTATQDLIITDDDDSSDDWRCHGRSEGLESEQPAAEVAAALRWAPAEARTRTGAQAGSAAGGPGGRHTVGAAPRQTRPGAGSGGLLNPGPCCQVYGTTSRCSGRARREARPGLAGRWKFPGRLPRRRGELARAARRRTSAGCEPEWPQ